MERLIVVIFCGLFLSGCTPYYTVPASELVVTSEPVKPPFKPYLADYLVALKEVESPANFKVQYGDTKIVRFEDAGVTRFEFEDDFIRTSWLVTSRQIAFTLTNKSDHTIKIVWDEAVYVDIEGLTHRVFHSGVKYSERNNPQPPTSVLKGARIEDLLAPIDKAYLDDSRYSAGWKQRPLFAIYINEPEAFERIKSQVVGKELKVLLPIKVEESVNEYIFTFKIEDLIKGREQGMYD